MSKVAQLSIFTAFLFISGFVYVKFYQPEELKPVQPTGRVMEVDMTSVLGQWAFVPQALRIKNFNDDSYCTKKPQKTAEAETILESYSIAEGNMPTELRVKVGDLVKICILNEDSFDHGFALEAFAINRRLFPNEKTLVEFIASKVGTSKFYCSVPCGEGHYQQIGTLIVEE